MNATATHANPRLKRIRIVSRVFRYLVLANLVFHIGFQVLFHSSYTFRGWLTALTFREVLMTTEGLLICFWFWKLAQLFRFYERGLIFAAETIRCIQVLGVVCLAGWLMIAVAHFTPPRPQPVYDAPPGVTVEVKTTTYRMGFFSFDFGTGIDFGLLFCGAAVVLAAWIMDEGRKIQEEQALTV